MGVVYRILNVANDHFYVGSTINPRRRRWEHWDALKKGVHHCAPLQEAWNEYGEDAFDFEVLEEAPDADILHIEETYLLKYVSGADCYNLAASAHQSPAMMKRVRDKISSSLKEKYANGGYTPRTGLTHSEETKAKISAKVQAALAEGKSGKFIPSEETRLRMSQALKGNQNAKGHVRSEEHRRKLAEAQKGNQNWLGRRHTEEAKLKMAKGVIEATSGREFPSLTAALEHYGLKMPTLQRALKTGKPLSKGPHAGLAFYYVGAPAPQLPETDYPTTRSEAQRLGAKYYYTGQPCSRGHVALRKTKGSCVECAKEDTQKVAPSRKEYFATYRKAKAQKTPTC